MFESLGRQSMEAYIGGKYYTVKRPLYRGASHSTTITLPKDWLSDVSNERVLISLLLNINDDVLTIKPHYSEKSYDDGKFHIVRLPIYTHRQGEDATKGSVAVAIPADWIVYLNRDKPVRYFLLEDRIGMMLVTPHYESIPDLEIPKEDVI